MSLHWPIQSNPDLYPYPKEALGKSICSRLDLMKQLCHCQIFSNKTSPEKNPLLTTKTDFSAYVLLPVSIVWTFFTNLLKSRMLKLKLKEAHVQKELRILTEMSKQVAQIKKNSYGKWIPEMVAFLRRCSISLHFSWMFFRGSIPNRYNQDSLDKALNVPITTSKKMDIHQKECSFTSSTISSSEV